MLWFCSCLMCKIKGIKKYLLSYFLENIEECLNSLSGPRPRYKKSTQIRRNRLELDCALVHDYFDYENDGVELETGGCNFSLVSQIFGAYDS